MNVVSYKYPDKRSSKPQFLYVDADYDAALFPPNVREIMAKSERPNSVRIDVIQRMGKAAAERFKVQHYLDPVFDLVEH